MDFNVIFKTVFNLLAIEVSTLDRYIKCYSMRAEFVSCEYDIRKLDKGVWKGGSPGNKWRGQLRVKCVDLAQEFKILV